MQFIFYLRVFSSWNFFWLFLFFSLFTKWFLRFFLFSLPLLSLISVAVFVCVFCLLFFFWLQLRCKIFTFFLFFLLLLFFVYCSLASVPLLTFSRCCCYKNTLHCTDYFPYKWILFFSFDQLSPRNFSCLFNYFGLWIFNSSVCDAVNYLLFLIYLLILSW